MALTEEEIIIHLYGNIFEFSQSKINYLPRYRYLGLSSILTNKYRWKIRFTPFDFSKRLYWYGFFPRFEIGVDRKEVITIMYW